MQKPISGFRYKCVKCKDHDICESCHATFLAGTLPHANKLNPMVSKDVSAHAFHAYVDGKSFKAIGGGKKNEPAVKKAKTKPNDPCTCNSGKVTHTNTHSSSCSNNTYTVAVGRSGLNMGSQAVTHSYSVVWFTSACFVNPQKYKKCCGSVNM